uniref:Uncharacterized protein n=1 Tax=Anguilla anguilla TaxID=7936 RepID=A0A0E9RUN9_ANGAN
MVWKMQLSLKRLDFNPLLKVTNEPLDHKVELTVMKKGSERISQ